MNTIDENQQEILDALDELRELSYKYDIKNYTTALMINLLEIRSSMNPSKKHFINFASKSWDAFLPKQN